MCSVTFFVMQLPDFPGWRPLEPHEKIESDVVLISIEPNGVWYKTPESGYTINGNEAFLNLPMQQAIDLGKLGSRYWGYVSIHRKPKYRQHPLASKPLPLP